MHHASPATRGLALAGVAIACAGCSQILWTAAVGPGLVAARLTDKTTKVTFAFVDDVDGHTIADASVQLGYSGGWYAPEHGTQGTTAANGEVTLKVTKGYSYTLYVAAAGYDFDQQKDLPEPAQSDPLPARIVVRMRRHIRWQPD